MPRRVEFTPALVALIRAQDGVVTTEQLFNHGVGKDPAKNRVQRGHWQRLLPGVLLTHGGEPTRRQRMIAAQLWGGEEAAIDDVCACHYHGLRIGRFDANCVHLVVPFEASARSRRWVHVRRTIAPIDVTRTPVLRYVVEPTAVLVAARGAQKDKEAMDLISRALQTELVTVDELRVAREMLGDKWCKRLDRVLVDVGVGLRSPAESLFRDLVGTSGVLPLPLFNQWLDLGDGGWPICADGLWQEAGMLHEVNGKAYHGWGLQYESTSARTERVVAAGVVSTQSTPLRLLRDGPIVLANLERTYAMYRGKGMPPGVRLIDPPDWAAA